MTRLYLVQHGEALDKTIDPERPLSEQGADDVEQMATFLSHGDIPIHQFIHSGKLRARQSAERMATIIAPECKPTAETDLSPNDPTEPWVSRIDSYVEPTMIVGHLPFMARLADRLLTGSEEAGLVTFQPGSVVCLEQTGEERRSLLWMIRPELLNAN